MIYVNSPIQIIDTDNQSKNIVMQYGLYSYNWFLKYLIVNYDQITFNNFNSSKTVIQIVSNPRPVISIVNGTNSNSTSIVNVDDQTKNWLLSGVDNYFKFSPNIQLVDSWTNYNIICNVDEYYFVGFHNFY